MCCLIHFDLYKRKILYKSGKGLQIKFIKIWVLVRYHTKIYQIAFIQVISYFSVLICTFQLLSNSYN